MRRRPTLAILGAVLGALSGVAVYDTMFPPIRVNYAFVVDESAIPIDYTWWAAVAGGAALGALTGWATSALLDRNRFRREQ